MAEVADAVDALRSLPYRHGSYAARNWGHPFHSLISYPSKLKPSIAHFLVYYFSKSGDTILDPFSGVGTIPFEACLQGRVGIGSDINPIAYHATKSKVDPPTFREAESVLNLLNHQILTERESVSPQEAEKEIVPFFHETTLRELLVARRFFANRNDRASSFVLTCLLHILHGNRPYALSRRSHNIMPWPPRGPFVYKPVIASLRSKVERMLADPLPLNFIRGMSIAADVNAIPVESESVDCILTSPPFHANRDFLRMNRIRLWFCGWDYAKQDSLKSRFVENQPIDSYRTVFKELSRVLRPQGVCVLHVGIVHKFDMASELIPLAKESDLSCVDTIGEDTRSMESHGIIARGATHTHQFVVLRRR